MTKKSYIWVVFGFLSTAAICLLLIIPAISNRIAKDEISLEHLITDKSAKIGEAVSLPVNQLYTVESYIERNKGNVEGIEDYAAAIVNNDYIRNLIIAPDCVVTQIYPDTEENRQVIGLDYYENTSEGNREAVLAAITEELLLAGPFTTVVGDKAISGRLPVILTDENGSSYLWGLVAITLKYPEILESAGLESLAKRGYIYELWHINVDSKEREVIDSNGTIGEDSNYIDRSIKVLNAEWFLRLSPIPRWYQYRDTWIYIFLSFAISTMVSVIVKKNVQLILVKKKLEVLVHYDHLTKILNRKGLFYELNNLIKSKRKMRFYYLDLNKFKDINDKYGHTTGDLVLYEFARRVGSYLTSSHLFARIGGDEFIVVCTSDLLCEEQMDSFWGKIYKEFEAPIITDKNEEIYITFSRGVAEYSSETDSIDEVISKADKRMYLEKKNKFKLNDS